MYTFHEQINDDDEISNETKRAQLNTNPEDVVDTCRDIFNCLPAE